MLENFEEKFIPLSFQKQEERKNSEKFPAQTEDSENFELAPETEPNSKAFIEERPFWGEFRGGEIDQLGEYKEPTKEQREKFQKSIERVAEVFEKANFQWYLDGAINISLYRNKQIRDHKDIDISVFKQDLSKLNKLLSEQGFGIFLNFEENGKKLMKKLTNKEISLVDESYLSVCKVDQKGKIHRETSDPFNFVDLHIHDKDSQGNTIISYNGVCLSKEFFKPLKKEISKRKTINLSHPAIVAYHKLHSNRPHDITDLKMLRPNLEKKDFKMLREVFKTETGKLGERAEAKIKEAWKILSPILNFTKDPEVISEALWTHPDLKSRRQENRASEYVYFISNYISKNPKTNLNEFLEKSLFFLEPKEQVEKKLKILDDLEENK